MTFIALCLLGAGFSICLYIEGMLRNEQSKQESGNESAPLPGLPKSN